MEFMNFKVGIVTTHRAINYGALLQAYALQKKIATLNGIDCEIIDYFPAKKIYGRKITFKFFNLKSIVYTLILFFNFRYRLSHKKKVLSFNNFVNDNLKLSKDTYRTLTEFDNKINQYDFLVCGSDQIWNLNLMDDPVFFLDFKFVNNKTTKVAYAPSITENLRVEQIETIKTRISDFNSLSLREEDSARKYSKIFNVKFEKVLDPVFFISNKEWDDIAVKPNNVKKPFVLTYGLVSDPLLKKAIYLVKNKYNNIQHVDIKIRPFNKYGANICTNNLSPGNFVWLFKNAEFICTSSFHGTCFSIIFNKKFVTCPSKDRSLRIDNILEISGLESRRLLIDDQLSDNIFSEIDYNSVNLKLDFKKKLSDNYLNKALNIEGKQTTG